MCNPRPGKFESTARSSICCKPFVRAHACTHKTHALNCCAQVATTSLCWPVMNSVTQLAIILNYPYLRPTVTNSSPFGFIRSHITPSITWSHAVNGLAAHH